MLLVMNGDVCCRRLDARLGVESLLLCVRPRLRPLLSGSGRGHAPPSSSAAPPAGLRSRLMSGVWADDGRARLSSLEDPEPEDSVEIRLTGRRSEESEGVADGARSLLLMEATDRRGDSEERDGMMSLLHDN